MAHVEHIDRNNKQAISKDCAPFTYCLTEINNTQADIDVDVVMPLYNLIRSRVNYLEAIQFNKDWSKYPILILICLNLKHGS